MTFYSRSPVRFGTVSMVTATLGANDPEVGSVCEEGDEKYIFVYNTGGSQISVGYGATVSAVTGYSVTVSTTADVDALVGVCKHATLTTATYGWLMTRGFATVKLGASSGVVAGQLLIAGSDGTFDAKTIATGYIGHAYGKAMTGTASAGTADAYIHIF